MAVNLVTITGNIETLIGADPSLGRLWFKLNRPDWNLGGNIFAPEFVEVVASAGGAFSIALQSTDDFENGAIYSAILKYRDTVEAQDKEFTLAQFMVPSGGPYELGDLLVAGTIPAVPVDVLAAAQAYALAAEQARDASVAAADRAEAIGVFDTRAEFISWTATNTVVNGRTYLVAGLPYTGQIGATVTGLFGLVPSGKFPVTPDHFADNTTPGTTNMGPAIQACVTYAQDAFLPASLIARAKYFTSQSIRISADGLHVVGVPSDSRSTAGLNIGSTIINGTGGDCIIIGREAATTPGTDDVKGVILEGLSIVAAADGNTGGAIHGQKITGCRFINVHCRGHKHNFWIEGGRDVDYVGCGCRDDVYTGAVGSAGVKIDSLTLTDATEYTGFTHRFVGCRLYGDASDSTVEINSIDFFNLVDCYLGTSKQHLLLKPKNNTADITNITLDNTYLDGVDDVKPSSAIVADGNGTTARMRFIRIIGGTIGQMSEGFVAKNNAALYRVEFVGVDMHNFYTGNAVRIDAGSGAFLDLQIKGGNLTAWNRNGTAVGDARMAILVNDAKSVSVEGVFFDIAPGSVLSPVMKFRNVDDILAVSRNIIRGDAGAIDYNSTCPNVLLNGNNAENEVIYDIDTKRRGTFTPVVADSAAGGNLATGTFSAIWQRTEGIVHVSMNLTDINTAGMTAANQIFVRGLPFTPLSGAANYALGVVQANFVTDSSDIRVRISPADNAVAFIKNAAGAAPVTVKVSDISSGVSDIFLNFWYRVT